MILVAGLTPAWQQILSFRQFVPGQVNRARIAVGCASGKVLNVGSALFFLGIDSKTICPIGGKSGQQIRADFEKLQVPVHWVESSVATRTCTTILDESNKETTELVENSHPVGNDELTRYYDVFVEQVSSANVVVITGSLPEGTPSNFFQRMLECTASKTVLDIRGDELNEALSTRPFVVKPNREELERTVGRKLISDSELIDAMSRIRDRGAQWVVVSSGPGTLFALGPDELIQIEPPKVPVINPIGCGDCLAAGIAAGIDRGLPMRRALEIGVRAATENAQNLLPARQLSRLD